MRNIGAAVIGGLVVAFAFATLNLQHGMAQQKPPNYLDISQKDFEAIDGIVKELAAALKAGDMEKFKLIFRKHSSPALQDTDSFAAAMEANRSSFGGTSEVKYIRHSYISNVTDYYVFYYAELKEKILVPWELTFYRTGGEWKIVGYRTDSKSPVEFFKFSELEYESFTR
jgi:hypothetical protein